MSRIVSLTLDFGEEDEGLWIFLQNFPQDQWEGLLKKALLSYQEHCIGEFSPEEKEKKRYESSTQGIWNLEELFVSPSSGASKAIKNSSFGSVPATASQSGTLDSLDSRPGNGSNPLSHLFELIGQEEDKELLDFLLHSKAQEQLETKEISSVPKEEEDRRENVSSGEPVSSKENLDQKAYVNTKAQEREILMTRDDKRKVTSIKGLDFLLNQVIGEEDDPEVLDFFSHRKPD